MGDLRLDFWSPYTVQYSTVQCSEALTHLGVGEVGRDDGHTLGGGETAGVDDQQQLHHGVVGVDGSCMGSNERDDEGGESVTGLYDVDVLAPHLVQQLHVGLVVCKLLQQDLARSHPNLPCNQLGQF